MSAKKALAERMRDAYALGVERGKLCDQDPYRYCEQFNISVEKVPERQLQRAARAEDRILARVFLPTSHIQLSAELSALEAKKALAHELGHIHKIEDGFDGEEAEDIADCFAAGMVAWVPSEQYRLQEQARAMAEDGLDRDRRAAAARSRARYA